MAEKDKWFEILSGKSNPNPKNRDEVEAAQLREAIGSYENSIGLNKITPENSYFRFKQKLKAREQQKTTSGFMSKLKQYKWETARLIAATAAGIAIATLPTVQMATRGGSESNVTQTTYVEEIASEVKLVDKNPLSLSQEIIDKCITAKLDVKMINSKKTQLIIYNLKPNEKKQIPIKAILNLNNNAAGNIKVIILRK